MPVSKRSASMEDSDTLAQLVALRAKLSVPDIKNGSLRERFLVPPFSVLDARQGYWQTRKKMWLELGIQSELGRGLNGLDNGEGKILSKKGRAFNCSMNPVPQKNDGDWGTKDEYGSGTSIFDPVLCELAYRWFCPPGGWVLDPFAGGSVRGVVAARLGRFYTGVELSERQAEANDRQREIICTDPCQLNWVVGDAMSVGGLCPGNYDFIFSCPPYADLEIYSDDPRDLSLIASRDYSKFLEMYKYIIAKCCNMLKNDRFACFVVGEIRDKKTGYYRNFVGDTVQAFRDAGLELYNDAILLTTIGSLPVRVGSQFVASRKLGKTHQNILIFIKGDPWKASEACGVVDIDDLEMPVLELNKVAICLSDVVGEDEGIDHIVGMYMEAKSQVEVVHLPLNMACILADVLRGRVRETGGAVPRTWIGTIDGWRKLKDGEELTYLVGGKPYLYREIFPDAPVPTVDRPTAHKLRGT